MTVLWSQSDVARQEELAAAQGGLPRRKGVWRKNACRRPGGRGGAGSAS
jgi:hypothetical protein